MKLYHKLDTVRLEEAVSSLLFLSFGKTIQFLLKAACTNEEDDVAEDEHQHSRQEISGECIELPEVQDNRK